MTTVFDQDPFPGQPKILFIGVPYSTHVHAWIDLLAGAEFNVRLFGVENGHPPSDWPIRTYVITPYPPEGLDLDRRQCLYPTPEVRGAGSAVPVRAPSPEAWLVRIIQEWQPDLIHTMGLEPAGEFYFRLRKQHELAGVGRWLHWLWGGSDIELKRLHPDIAPWLTEFLRDCDQILSDNALNHQYLEEMGIPPEKIASVSPVPGSGGVEVDRLAAACQDRPSQRRLILWPKAYDSPWSMALPVFEALKLCWDQIQPCTIHMLSMGTEGTRMWYHALPEPIRRCSRIYLRVPREDVLRLMAQSRVMLAPTMIDGFPNTVYEAMACGACPVVSPLGTLTPVLRDGANALFARNLYPQEIADALIRAMTDDALVDATAQRNLDLVRELADRSKIRPRVLAYYHEQAAIYRRSDSFRVNQQRFGDLAAHERHVPEQMQGLQQAEARLAHQAAALKAREADLEQSFHQRAMLLQAREAQLAAQEARLTSRRLSQLYRAVRRILGLSQG